MSTDKRDGFVVKRIGEEGEFHFVKCSKNGNLRDRALSGLLRNMGDEFYVIDTRDERP